jgi:hypothetical protein
MGHFQAIKNCDSKRKMHFWNWLLWAVYNGVLNTKLLISDSLLGNPFTIKRMGRGVAVLLRGM